MTDERARLALDLRDCRAERDAALAQVARIREALEECRKQAEIYLDGDQPSGLAALVIEEVVDAALADTAPSKEVDK
jgi:DNA gyrase/topoisomerase IV subunit B